jgi:hypothetical protein
MAVEDGGHLHRSQCGEACPGLAAEALALSRLTTVGGECDEGIVLVPLIAVPAQPPFGLGCIPRTHISGIEMWVPGSRRYRQMCAARLQTDLRLNIPQSPLLETRGKAKGQGLKARSKSRRKDAIFVASRIWREGRLLVHQRKARQSMAGGRPWKRSLIRRRRTETTRAIGPDRYIWSACPRSDRFGGE